MTISLKTDGLDALEQAIQSTPKSHAKKAKKMDELEPNYIDLYEWGRDFIYNNFGYIVEPDASKTYNAYLGVYTVDSPPKGIVCPSNIKLKYPVFNGQRTKWNRQINRIFADLGQQEYGEKLQKFWAPFFFQDNPDTALPKFIATEENSNAQAITSLKDDRPYSQGICINPTEDLEEIPRAIVPQLNWFPQEIQDLKAEDICTLFPETELKLFMLVMGRAMIGRSGSKLVNGPVVNHMFRKMAIVYGEDGGTGKSYFKNLLISTMAKYGYSIAQPLDLNSRFNQYNNYTSDLSVTDDLTQESMGKFINGQAFKSLITGTSTLGTEAKGKDRIDVIPTCALMAITNTFDQNSIYTLDTGAISRLSVLYTHTHDEFASMEEELGHSVKPFDQIARLKEQFSCNEHMLMGRFMRHCVDFFWSKYEDNLESYTTKISANLRFPYVTEVVPNMMEAARLAHLLKEKRSPAERTNKFFNVKGFEQVMFDYFWLVGSDSIPANQARNLIKQDWVENGKPSKHPWKGIRLINKYSLISAFSYLGTSGNLEIGDLQKIVFDQLKDTDGTKIGSAPKYLNTGYSAACTGLKGKRLVRLSNKIREQLVEDEKLRALGDVVKLMASETLSLEYTKEAHYDPKNHVKNLDEEYNSL